MKKRHFILIFSLVLLTGSMLYAQSREETTDSIQLVLDQLPADIQSVNWLIKEARGFAWSDIKIAEMYAHKAMLLSEELNYTEGLAQSKYQLALLFKDYDFKIAETLTLEALEHSRTANDSVLMGKIYNTIGNMKDNVSESKNAEIYYNRALQIFDMIGHDSLKARVYNNLGILYDDRELYDTAQFFFNNAAAVNQRQNNEIGLAINYLNLGYSYILAGNRPAGLNYLDKSLEIAIAHDYQRLLPYIYNNYSEHYQKEKNNKKAIQYALKGLEIAREQNNRLQEKNALELLKDAYFKNNNLKKAYACAEEIMIVNDSINQYSKLKEVDLLEMRYAFEQERSKQQFQQELLKAKLKQKELSIILIAGGAGLVLLIFVFLFVLQQNRIKRKILEQKTTKLEKEKLEQELDFKNKELTTNVMYLIRKNEFITNITQKLKNTEQADNAQKNKGIKSIITEMERSLKNDNWADFEVRFQEVHVDFYNKLSNLFPDLTPNELRLCAFLKLNMTSKEIAGITYQSVDSLKAARYRLRKKLGITREDNLVTFLTRI